MTDPTLAPDAAPGAFAAPALECDVLVQGGLASGAACPPRVLELARTHRLRCVDATPSGAVAAALTAAAEYGRERGGFGKLAALDAWLADGTHLAGLFQPTRAARPLLALLFSLERRGRPAPAGAGAAGLVAKAWSRLPRWVSVVFVVIPGALRDALPWHFWIATVLGCMVGGALDVVLADGVVDATHPLARTVLAIVFPVMFIGSYLASLGACAWRLWRLASAVVPQQGHGICTGLTPGAPSSSPALTAWLHHALQDLAGLPESAPPLTVGALRAKRVAGSNADAGIELRMVATSSAPGQSLVLPGEAERFLFREDDMRRLFPGPVVDHLLAASPGPAPGLAGYHALPAPAALPVLVLARMSVDLPVLLAAVPLYAVNAGANGSRDDAPQQVWFGHVGLLGNFPWHRAATSREDSLARLALLRDRAAREHDGGAGMRRALVELASPAPAGVLRVAPRA